MTQSEIKDIAIIGAGPVGLFAAFQCGMLGLTMSVIDALPDIGGQCAALYPEKPIYDIAGLPDIKAGQLIDNLIHQAAPFLPAYHLGGQVVSLIEDGNGLFHLVTDKGAEITAKAVIIAAGPGAFGPNRPPLDGIEEFETGGTLHYMVKDLCRFDGQTIMIAGGGDSAVDWANALAPRAEKIYLVHRRDKFRAAPHAVKRMETYIAQGKIEKFIPCQLKGLSGIDGKLNAVDIAEIGGDVRRIAVTHLICLYGLNQNLGAIRDWGLNIEGYHIPIDPTTGATKRRGIYAIGDIATYPHKLKLIATGFAEAAQAAYHAYGVVKPGQALHFEYSTTRGLPSHQKEQETEGKYVYTN